MIFRMARSSVSCRVVPGHPLVAAAGAASTCSRCDLAHMLGGGFVVPACEGVRVVVVFEGQLWSWDARRADSWVFVTLPEDESEEIREVAGGVRRGFGSLRGRATVGT